MQYRLFSVDHLIAVVSCPFFAERVEDRGRGLGQFSLLDCGGWGSSALSQDPLSLAEEFENDLLHGK